MPPALPSHWPLPLQMSPLWPNGQGLSQRGPLEDGVRVCICTFAYVKEREMRDVHTTSNRCRTRTAQPLKAAVKIRKRRLNQEKQKAGKLPD